MMWNSKDVSLLNSSSSSPSPASSSSSPPFSTRPSVEAEAGSGRAVGMERSAQDLPNTGAESNTDAAKKLRRKRCCWFCRNHLKTVPVIDHNCPYATCMCTFCDLTRRRREVMLHQLRLWRFEKGAGGCVEGENSIQGEVTQTQPEDQQLTTFDPATNSARRKMELASSNPNQRNWRGIIIAVLVICFVLGMIVTSVLLLTPPDDGPRVKGRRFELEDILGDDFKIHTFNGTWVSDHKLVYKDPAGGLSVFDAETLTSKVLVSNITFRQLNVAHFSPSPDLQYVLLAEHVEKVFRYSFKAKYHIFNCQTQHHSKLSPTPEDRGHPPLLLARWAPRSTAIVMVDDHYNIVYRPEVDKETVRRLTHNGKPGVIHNGVPDWVYEEEILHSNSALWFSPDGSKLAYASLNDSLVGTVAIPHYGAHQQYPTMHDLRYPKPGQENPRVTLWVIDLDNPRTIMPRDLKPPNVVKDQNHYFTAVSWVDNSMVSVVWMNRAQNTSVITLCSPPLYFCETTHREQSGGGGWVELYDAPIFSQDGQSFLVRLPVRNGNQGEFKHVNLYNVRMHQVIPITHGAYEVTEILGWDQSNNYIYYIATMEEKPGGRHLFRTSDVTSPMMLMPDCLSCLEADNKTDTCLYNRAHFSTDFSYYVLECLGPDVPRTYLFSTTWSNQ